LNRFKNKLNNEEFRYEFLKEYKKRVLWNNHENIFTD
jgi:hypothetical protein